MKRLFFFSFIVLLFALPSCYNNKSQEQLRAECDSLLHLAADSYDADLREAAYNYYNQAILLDTTYWRSYQMKADAYYFDEKYDSAIVAYEKLYVLNRNHDTLTHGIFYRMARSYHELELYEKALIIAQEGLLANPNDFWLMDEVSLCYTLQKKYDLAENWALKELNTHENDAAAYFRLAWINGKLGRTSKAIECYEQLLVLQPDNHAAMNNLSIHYWNRDRTKAIELKKKAAQLGNDKSREWCKENGYDY